MTAPSLHSVAAANRIHGTVLTAALVIAICTVVVYALAGSATTLFDRDEPRFAQATIEMIDSGNWLLPTFAGKLRPDKPILIYWLMSVPVRLLGNVEWALRLPSAFGVGIAAMATFFCARRLVNDRAALLAMLVLVSSPLTMMMGTAATADGWLLGMTTAALTSFVVAITSTTRLRTCLALALLALFCGLAQLTKGPVALAVVGLPVLAMLCVGWNRIPGARRLLFPATAALAISVGIFLAWAIPANAATQGEFASQGIGKHVVARVLAPMEGHGGSFLLTLPYYIPVVIAGFFPWTLFLPSALAGLARVVGTNDDATRRQRFLRLALLAWIVPTFVLMSVVATKLPHYVLPIWPALAIAVAWAIERDMPAARAWRITGIALFFFSTLVAIAGFIAAPFLVPSTLDLVTTLLAAILFGGLCLSAYLLARSRRYRRAAVTLALGMLVTQQYAAFGVLRSFERIKLSPRIAQLIAWRVPPDTPVLAVRFGEPSLVYELWPRRVQIEGAPEAIASWEAGTGPAVLIAPIGELQSEALRMPAVGSRFEMIAPLYGFNYSTGDWLWVAVIGRDLEPVDDSVTRSPVAR